jgi:hypothetical protein
MSEYKYTKDGKKVVVIGKLNNSEYIVQEIFCSNGQEMPGGENFVATGLLDEPAKSWQQTQAEKWEAEYDRLNKSLDDLRRKERFESDFTRAVRARLESYKDISALDQLCAFLNNEIEYVVKYDKILAIQDVLASKDYGHFSNLKLLTLAGDPKCGLNWHLNYYSDGSGGWGSEVYLATSLDEAKRHLESQIKAKPEISKSDVETQQRYGLKYPSKSQLRKHHQQAVKTKKDAIKKAEAELAKQKKELEELNDEY